MTKVLKKVYMHGRKYWIIYKDGRRFIAIPAQPINRKNSHLAPFSSNVSREGNSYWYYVFDSIGERCF